MTRALSRPTTRPGEPVWEIAELFPGQGLWSEEEYLALRTRRLIEFDNGTIEVLPVPTRTHQLVVAFLYEVLKAFIAGNGRVFFAPYRLRVGPGKYREPDVMYLTPDQDARAGEEFTDAAEVAVEVVSPDNPGRDYGAKRRDYAAAGVAEYWIVDRDARQVLVLRLDNGQYRCSDAVRDVTVRGEASDVGIVVYVVDVVDVEGVVGFEVRIERETKQTALTGWIHLVLDVEERRPRTAGTYLDHTGPLDDEQTRVALRRSQEDRHVEARLDELRVERERRYSGHEAAERDSEGANSAARWKCHMLLQSMRQAPPAAV